MECALKYICGEQGTLISLSKDFGNGKTVTMKMDLTVQEPKLYVENKSTLLTGLSLTMEEMKTLNEIADFMKIAEEKFRKPLPSDTSRTKEGFMILRRSDNHVEMYYEPLHNADQSLESAITFIDELMADMSKKDPVQEQEQPYTQESENVKPIQPPTQYLYQEPSAFPDVRSSQPNSYTKSTTSMRPLQQPSCTITRPSTQEPAPFPAGPAAKSIRQTASIRPFQQIDTFVHPQSQEPATHAFHIGLAAPSAFGPFVQNSENQRRIEPHQIISICHCDAPHCECDCDPANPAYEPVTPVKRETKRKSKKLSLTKRKKSDMEIERELLKIYNLTKDNSEKKEKKE